MFNPERFEGNRGEVQNEAKPEIPPTETELRARERELKARYEDPRRKVEASMLWKERAALRAREHDRIKQLERSLSVAKRSSAADIQNTRDIINNELWSVRDNIQNAEESRVEIEKKKKNRGLFQKIKYHLIDDPLNEELSSLTETIEKYQREIDEKIKKSESTELSQSASLRNTIEDLNSDFERGKEGYRKSKKGLLEKAHGINAASHEAIRNTFLSLEKGELDIKRLAVEANAVVVHAIPIDVQSMKTISKERGATILAKSPDLSASIISANSGIEGQKMFYPFGFILDGKIIASYEGDEGTHADGLARRREEHSNGTLQVDTKKEFNHIANSAAKAKANFSHNESIVHKPHIRGILIDESGMAGTMTTIEEALAFAHNNYKEYPVYIRKADGIYSQDGKKVTANDIYS